MRIQIFQFLQDKSVFRIVYASSRFVMIMVVVHGLSLKIVFLGVAVVVLLSENSMLGKRIDVVSAIVQDMDLFLCTFYCALCGLIMLQPLESFVY